MNTALILCAAMALDAVAGEPAWLWNRLPHPAVLMGRAVGWCDKWFNNNTRANGMFALAGLVLLAAALGALLSLLGPMWPPWPRACAARYPTGAPPLP